MLPTAAHSGPGRSILRVARRGVTLIEVITAAGVISLLAAILLPAVQSARERARMLQCADNLRQIGLAVLAHESVHGELPQTSMVWGDPAAPQSPRPCRSVHSSLLPWLDQQQLANRINPDVLFLDEPGKPIEFCAVREPGAFLALPLRETEWDAVARHPVPVFRCPSDPANAPGGNNYRACMGSWPQALPPDPRRSAQPPQAHNGAFVAGRATRFRDFADGTSPTALFSERVIGDFNPDQYDPFRDIAFHRSPMTPEEAEQQCSAVTMDWPGHDSFLGSTWLFGGWRQTWYNHVFPPNHRVPDCGSCAICVGGAHGPYTARSFHPSGVNVLFADGHVESVAAGIDAKVWHALGTRAESRLDPPEPAVANF